MISEKYFNLYRREKLKNLYFCFYLIIMGDKD